MLSLESGKMTLFIRLLGPAHIQNNDKPITIKGYKPLALLAYLLVTGRSHTRQHLVDLLHDESDDPRRSLRWTLNQLRQAIGPASIVADRKQIGFNFERDYRCDVQALLEGELDSYGGDFLEGLYVKDAHRFMDWAFYERERLRAHYQEMLGQQLAAQERHGNYEAVLDLGHQLIQLDNLREAGYRAVMQAYALLGNREAALAQYEACCQVLADELGLEPEPETVALFERIQTGNLTDPRGLADLPVQLPDFLQGVDDHHEAHRSIFVARNRELAQLDHFLQQALAGQGQVVFMTGGAGQGKTALLNAFASRAQAAWPELLVADGHCDLYSGLGDPYLPFRDILGMLSGDVAVHLASGRVTLEQARRLWQNTLPACQALLEQGQNLIDILVARQPLLSRARQAAPSGARPLRVLAELQKAPPGEVTQENLFQQLTNVLRALAGRRPLLLLLDDLQWADSSSISLLFHLSRRLTDSSMMIVGAYRPEDVALGRAGQRHPLEPVLAEIKRLRGDIWLDLGQDQEETRHFVDAYLDAGPNRLSPAFRQALYDRTRGHPLFTVELLQTLQERGDIFLNEQGQLVEGDTLNWTYLPARVEAVIEERIGRLEEDLRQVLTVASVDGEEFTAQVVAQVQALNERHLLGQLSRALAKKHRLVQGRGEIRVGNKRLSRYQFAHALFQRYLYNDLSPEERRLLHAEVGAVLEDLYGEHAAEIAGQLAWHFQEGEIPDKACPYLFQAGRQAARHHANDEALAYFSRALALLPQSATEDRFEVLLAREKVYDLQGERDHQEQDLTALHRLAEALADDRRRAEVALRWSNYSEATSDYLATVTMARTAITLARAAEDPEHEARGYLLWGQALWRQGHYDPAQQELKQALTLAQEFPHLKARALRHLGQVAWHQGDYAQARHHFAESLQVFRQIGDRQGEGLSLNNLGIISALQGDYPGANDAFEQALRIGRQVGDRQSESNILNNLGIVAGHQGDYERARDYYEQALPVKREIDDRRGEAMVLDNLGDVARYQGDYAQAQRYFTESLALRREVGDRQGEGNELNNLGNVAHYQGDYARAREYYEQSLVIRREIGDRQGEAEGLAYLSLLAHHTGDERAALPYGEQALRLAEALGDQHLLGYVWTHLGHARAGLGRLAEAEAAYQEALTIRQALGQPNRAMEPLAGLARVALKQDQPSLALTHVEKILAYLEAHSLEGTEEPYRVHLTCYEVLYAAQDVRASAVLGRAQRLLREQAARIGDEALRRAFLENVATHRALLKASLTDAIAAV